MDPLTLDQIDVYGLFTPDTNYTEIKLNDPERTTIIHGINGCGKTTLMKMLYGFFTGDYNIFKKTRFNSFHLHFSDGTTIRIYSHFFYLVRQSLEDNSYDKFLHFFEEYMDNNCAIFLEYISNTNLKNYEIFVINPEGIETLRPDYVNSSNIEEIKSKIREYEDALSERYDRNKHTMSVSEGIEELFESMREFRNRLDHNIDTAKLNANPSESDIYPHIFSNEPLVLKDIRNNIHVVFIRTERLVNSLDHSSEGKSAIDECDRDYHSILNNIANITRQKSIHSALNFPDRLITKFNDITEDEYPTIPELEKKIESLNDELDGLCFYGIYPELELDKRFENTIIDEDPGRIELLDASYRLCSDRLINPVSRVIIGLALDDAINNILNFKPLMDNMDYLCDLISELKAPSIELPDCCVAKVSNRKGMSQTYGVLSSGEQNLFKILLELLFKPLAVYYRKLGEGSFEYLDSKLHILFLIDEPESSLHIIWQQELLEKMLSIQKRSELTTISMLIATHSPDFINDRWDLTYSMNPSGRD